MFASAADFAPDPPVFLAIALLFARHTDAPGINIFSPNASEHERLMKKRLLSRCFLIWVGALCCACGGSSPSGGKVEPICSGSDEVQLFYRVMPSWGRLGAGEYVLYENGDEYLVVDGECQYWALQMNKPEGAWSSVRTGYLTDEEAENLSRDVRYGGLDELAGYYRQRGTYDYPRREITDGRHVVACTGQECASEKRESVLSKARSWLSKLYERGEPVETGLRVAMFRPNSYNQSTVIRIVDMPSELEPYLDRVRPLGSFAGCRGDTFTVSEQAESTVRTLREPYRNEEYGDFWYRYIPLKTEGEKWVQLYARDSIPPENDNGVIEFGFPSVADSGADCDPE